MVASWKHRLLDMTPCGPGLIFALLYREPETAWTSCGHGEWMLWALDKAPINRKAELIVLLKKWIPHFVPLSDTAKELLADHEHMTMSKIDALYTEEECQVMHDFYYFVVLKEEKGALASLAEAMVDAALISTPDISRLRIQLDLANLIRIDIPRIMEWLDD